MKRRSGEIPEDVLFKILIRLPVKSLCKLRAVSNSWLRIISDPNFIRSHYDVAKNRPRLLLVDSIGRSEGPTWGCLVHDADGWKLVEAVRVPNSPDPRYFPSPSVRGLICLGRGRDHIGILNPSTQEYASIPLPPFCSPRLYTETRYTCFGFDSLANKHKLLFSHGTSSLDPEHRLKRATEHWLFTLGSGERWRRVGISENHVKCDRQQEVCIDGVIYFMVRKLEPPYYQFSLAAFDLRSESCQLTGLGLGHPDFVSNCKLLEFNGQVALVHNHLNYRYHPADGPLRFDLWVLGDFHKQDWAVKRSVWVPDSWREVIHREGLDLACALHGGELLVFKPYLQEGPNLDLFFYNVESSRFWTTRIHTPVGDVYPKGACRTIMCYNHIESLLPLKAP